MVNAWVDRIWVDRAFDIRIANILRAIHEEIVFNLDLRATLVTKAKEIEVTYLVWCMKDGGTDLVSSIRCGSGTDGKSAVNCSS